MTIVMGFYWARRRDGGAITIVQAWSCGATIAFNLFGTPHCPNLAELQETHEIIARVSAPAEAP